VGGAWRLGGCRKAGEAVRIAVITPTIAPRANDDLERAKRSVREQVYPAYEHIVEEDVDKEGPAIVRNRAVEKTRCEWIAFLDDDDYLLPNHLSALKDEWFREQQHGREPDIIWPWFRVEGGADPFPQFQGRQFDINQPHIFPITVLLRKAAFDEVGGFLPSRGHHPDGHDTGEDFNLWLRLAEAGFTFHHTPDITWVWRHHGRNTSGLPSRW
jgi:glycosyltransferase involved in cell wall biosynthesis